VTFAEGGSDEGDILVGADGAGSAVRKQLLPHATARDVGLRCIYGRMAVTEATGPLIPEDFRRGFCWVADQNGYGAGFAPVRFRSGPSPDYLMITLVATPAPTPRCRMPRCWPANCFPRKGRSSTRWPPMSGSCCRAASPRSKTRSRWLAGCSPKPASRDRWGRLCLQTEAGRRRPP
jgi:2-polyprenyl-6-methoxyphenol hydroxylase-like FAD-dependent oxidoreductase